MRCPPGLQLTAGFLQKQFHDARGRFRAKPLHLPEDILLFSSPALFRISPVQTDSQCSESDRGICRYDRDFQILFVIPFTDGNIFDQSMPGNTADLALQELLQFDSPVCILCIHFSCSYRPIRSVSSC